MKIGEKFHDDEGSKFVVEEIHDVEPTLKAAEGIRQMTGGIAGESRHVARVPGVLFYEWLREAGVSPTDTRAAEEIIKRKMLSGDVAKFRIWEGMY